MNLHVRIAVELSDDSQLKTIVLSYLNADFTIEKSLLINLFLMLNIYDGGDIITTWKSVTYLVY